jgi:hypothetical protein
MPDLVSILLRFARAGRANKCCERDFDSASIAIALMCRKSKAGGQECPPYE